MGMVTLHLVIGVGIFILPLFLLLFSLVTMTLAHLYIVIGSVSFVASVLTTIVLVTKFVNQPEAHGFFSYSDTVASALMSLGLMLDGIMYLLPTYDTPCYQYKLIYGLFIVPIITSFFSVLGMAIERFQAFAVYRDRRKLTKTFSIAWFLSSWTLAICFLVILLAQISEKKPANKEDQLSKVGFSIDMDNDLKKQFYINILDLDLFPGPHSEMRGANLVNTSKTINGEEVNNTAEQDHDAIVTTNEIETPSSNLTRIFVSEPTQDYEYEQNVTSAKGIQCRISSRPFIMYYLILLFLLCFATPVLITTSLNVFIFAAVKHTTYEVISHHQWLTLSACVLMWGPSLTERLLAKWDLINPPLVVSAFLFLLGHTHNLLRSVLHAAFAQQIHSLTWQTDPLPHLPPQKSRLKWTSRSSISSSHKKQNKINPDVESVPKSNDPMETTYF